MVKKRKLIEVLMDLEDDSMTKALMDTAIVTLSRVCKARERDI